MAPGVTPSVRTAAPPTRRPCATRDAMGCKVEGVGHPIPVGRVLVAGPRAKAARACSSSAARLSRASAGSRSPWKGSRSTRRWQEGGARELSEEANVTIDAKKLEAFCSRRPSPGPTACSSSPWPAPARRRRAPPRSNPTIYMLERGLGFGPAAASTTCSPSCSTRRWRRASSPCAGITGDDGFVRAWHWQRLGLRTQSAKPRPAC